MLPQAVSWRDGTGECWCPIQEARGLSLGPFWDGRVSRRLLSNTGKRSVLQNYPPEGTWQLAKLLSAPCSQVRKNPNPVQNVRFWQSTFSISLRSSNSDMVSFSQLFSPLLGATETELLVLFLCVSLQKAFVEGGSLPCPLHKYEWPQASRTQILVGWPECSQQWHGMWLSISHQHIAKTLCMGMHGRRLWIISSNVFAPFFGCCKSDAARKKYINKQNSVPRVPRGKWCEKLQQWGLWRK